MSPYGVRSPEGLGRLWSRIRGKGQLQASTGGAPDGVLLLRGDGIAEAALLDRPLLVDAAPTLLYSLGLPLARDFDGRLVSGAFTGSFLQRTTLTFLPSYETLTGFTPRLRPTQRDTPLD